MTFFRIEKVDGIDFVNDLAKQSTVFHVLVYFHKHVLYNGLSSWGIFLDANSFDTSINGIFALQDGE